MMMMMMMMEEGWLEEETTARADYAHPIDMLWWRIGAGRSTWRGLKMENRLSCVRV